MERQAISDINELKTFLNSHTFLLSSKDKLTPTFADLDFNFPLMIQSEIDFIVKDNVIYSGSKSYGFDNCNFNQGFFFSHEIKKEYNFNDCVFKVKAQYTNAKFNKNIRFHSCDFDCDTDFTNTKFNKLIDFWHSTFYKPIIFYKTDFLATTVFSGATFKENVLFTYSLIADKIIFRGTKIVKGLDLSLAIISGNLNLFDIQISRFNHSEPNSEKEYDEDVSSNGEVPLKNKKETYRLLKKHFETQSSNVRAIDMKFLERSAQSREINIELKRVKRHKDEDIYNFFGKKLNALANFFILLLNFFSNLFGKSYVMGIIFTLLISGLFFNLMLSHIGSFSFTSDYSQWQWKYFVQFINPTHRFDFMKEIDVNPKRWFYIWDFIGRIFISYGIYQTVQAFRKYK